MAIILKAPNPPSPDWNRLQKLPLRWIKSWSSKISRTTRFYYASSIVRGMKICVPFKRYGQIGDNFLLKQCQWKANPALMGFLSWIQTSSDLYSLTHGLSKHLLLTIWAEKRQREQTEQCETCKEINSSRKRKCKQCGTALTMAMSKIYDQKAKKKKKVKFREHCTHSLRQ